MSVDIDAISYIPKEEHDQHMEADLLYALISQAAHDTSLMEAYSYNSQVTETLDMQKDPKVMSVRLGYHSE